MPRLEIHCETSHKHNANPSNLWWVKHILGIYWVIFTIPRLERHYKTSHKHSAYPSHLQLESIRSSHVMSWNDIPVAVSLHQYTRSRLILPSKTTLGISASKIVLTVNCLDSDDNSWPVSIAIQHSLWVLCWGNTAAEASRDFRKACLQKSSKHLGWHGSILHNNSQQLIILLFL